MFQLFNASFAQSPTTKFSGSPVAGCNPLKVDFKNQSIDAIKYTWFFGNGNSSNLFEPSAIYNNPGQYSVTLISTNKSGLSDTLILTNYITVFKSPIAAFNITKKELCTNESVSFVNKTIKGDGTITKIKWDFGDGSVSNMANPSYSYKNDGKFDITIAVEDTNGCKSSEKGREYISVYGSPMISFFGDSLAKCNAPALVKFKSVCNGFSPFSYNWDFGDGQTSTLPNIEHSFYNNGNYNVSFKVIDSRGCSSLVKKVNYIQINNPIADFTVSDDTICAGSNITFFNKSTPVELNGKYRWNLDDGDLSEVENPKKVFKNPGKYTISLIYYWDKCSTKITKVNYIVVNPNPTGRFLPGDTSVCRAAGYSFPVQFKGNDFSEVAWKINNSKPKNLTASESFSIRLDTFAIHKISVVVKSSFGCQSLNDSFQLKVIGPKADISMNKNAGCIPFDVNASWSGISESPIVSYTWVLNGKRFPTNKSTHSFNYNKFGAGYLSVEVADANGCKATAFRGLGGGVPVVMDFSANKTKLCNNERFSIYNGSKPRTMDSVAFYYSWFNNDTILFGNNDSIITSFRDKPGSKYNLTFTANSFGCMSQLPLEKQPVIEVVGPKIEGVVKPFCESYSIIAINTSYNVSDAYWKFIDSNKIENTSFDKNLSLGLNNVKRLCLYAFNDKDKCKDSMIFKVSIDTNKVKFSYDFNCVTGLLQTQNQYPDLNDTNFKWTLINLNTNKISEVKSRNLKMVIAEEGQYKLIMQSLSKYFLCNKTFEAVFSYMPKNLYRPKVELDRVSCFPVNITLKDSKFGNWKKANWIINNQIVLADSAENISYTHFDNKRTLEVMLNKTDSFGCAFSDTFIYNIGGIRAGIGFSQDNADCNKPICSFSSQVNGYDPAASYSYLWNFGKKVSSQKNDTLKLHKSEILNVSLIVKDVFGCETVANGSFDVKIGKPRALFYTNDSIKACPPLNVNFNDKSDGIFSDITKRKWHFGDSTFSEHINPGKLYVIPGKFKVSLIVSNTSNCSDTFTLPELIEVKGTNGSFSIDKKVGCTPMEVKIETKLKGTYAKLNFDLGDGMVLSQQPKTYTYTKAGVYIPRLIIIDSNGCKFSPVPKDSVTVHQTPIAFFESGPVCDNVNYSIVNKSISTNNKQVSWKADGKQIGFNDTLNMRFRSKGAHKVSLKVVTQNHCEDSITKTFVSYGMSLNLTIPKDEYCLGNVIQFGEKSVSDTFLVSRIVKMNGKSIQYSNPLKYIADTRGKINVIYIATDAIGCKDSIDLNSFIKVGDTLAPKPLLIYRSSVIDNLSTETKFSASNQPDFKDYHLYIMMKNQWVKVISSSNKCDTVFSVQNLNTLSNAYCHQIRERNYCGVYTDSTKVISHCTVESKAIGDTNVSNLKWTPYIGWGKVANYKIWRKRKSDSNFKFVNSVSGDVNEYVDSSTDCHIKYEFKIEAIEKGGFNQNSLSDTSESKPIHKVLVPVPEVWLTTVDNNKLIRTEWFMPIKPVYEIASWTIEKNESGIWKTLGTKLNSSIKTFEDLEADFKNSNFDYRVKATDVCNTSSNFSNVGRNILLNISQNEKNDNPKLTWTPYIHWSEGVSLYRIERSVMGSEFALIGEVAGNVLTFDDKNLSTSCQKDFVYRVVAVRKQVEGVPGVNVLSESYSNYQAYVPEIKFYIPNAFTPDKNNLNEGFKPVGKNFFKYNMQIFNRYGQKIYENEDCFNAWDGRYMSQDSPEGVYVYIIQAFDLAGNKFDFKGTVQLLK